MLYMSSGARLLPASSGREMPNESVYMVCEYLGVILAGVSAGFFIAAFAKGSGQGLYRILWFVIAVVCGSSAGFLLTYIGTMSMPSEAASANAARQLAHGADTARKPTSSKIGLAEVEFLAERLNGNASGNRVVQSVTSVGVYHYSVVGSVRGTNDRSACVVYHPATTEWSYNQGRCR